MNRSMSELRISDSDYDSEYDDSYEYSTADYDSEYEINDVPDPNRTELHAAAELNDLSLVKKLLSLSSDINAKDRLKKTPLHLAAKSNLEESHFKLIKFLLKKGASVQARDNESRTPLFYLVENCTKKMLQLFLDYKANVHIQSYLNESLLFSAVRNTENLKVVQKLINLGLSVNHQDKFNITPLLSLLKQRKDYEKYLKMIEMLLVNGASTKFDTSPLVYAIEQNNFKMFQLFLDYNTDVHAMNYEKRNLFYNAIRCNANHDFLRYLVDRGLDINHRDSYRSTPLHEAAKINEDLSHFGVIEFLLENGASINVRDCDNLTPLWYLVQDGNFKIVQLFFNHKPNFMNVVDDRRCNLLFQALTWRSDNWEVLQLLLNQGLNVNHRNENETTPLHEAASSNSGNSYLKVIKILLENKADVNAVDSEGRTPLQYLMRRCSVEIFELFLSYQADVHVVDREGRNLLFYAIKNPDVLQHLVDLGLDVNRCMHSSKSMLLHFVCAKGANVSLKVVKLLLRHGANLNAVDSEGYTPLMRAVRRCNRIRAMKKIDIIIESTDFRNTESNFNLEYNNYKLSSRDHRNCLFLITRHLAILQSLDIPIKLDFLGTILLKKRCDGYFEKCLNELSRAKSVKLKNSWITYYDLLVGTRKKLKNYAGNEDLIKDFQESNCEEKFTIYGSIMEKNIERGIKRRELFDKSTIIFSDCLPILNPNHLIIRDILDCVLSKRDLLKFCN